MKNISKLISGGESEVAEFKRSFNKDVIETTVAFANTRGGVILIGVSDAGDIVGTACGDESVQSWMNEIKQSTSPSITFFNPGKLYGGLTVEELMTDSYQSRTRNKLIAEAFYLTHDIEKYGSGYLRVRREIADYPTMTFSYRESGDGYLVRLEYSEQRTETTPKTTPKTRDRLLALIKSNPRITREEMAGAVGISVNGVKKHIDVLKKNGVLSRVGNNRTGHWEVK